MTDTLTGEQPVKYVPYATVNGMWPKGELPKLDGREAIKAAGLLMREGLRWHKVKRNVNWKWKLTSGNRDTKLYQVPRIINPDSGWHDLVHRVSHWVHYRANPGLGAHEAHAMTEKHLIQYVLDNGWLEGKLKRAPKPIIPTTEKRKASVEASIARWTSKLKRAQTALRKLERQRKYYAKPRLEPKPRAPREKKPPLRQQCIALADTLGVEIDENDIHLGQHFVSAPDGMSEEDDPYMDEGHYAQGWREVMERLKTYQESLSRHKPQPAQEIST